MTTIHEDLTVNVSSNAISNQDAPEYLSRALAFIMNEETNRKQATQYLCFSLVRATEQGLMPAGIDMTVAYKSQDRESAKTRNNLLLAHVFKVLNVEHDSKGKPSYKEKNDNQVPLALLKTRINRVLSPVAWLLKAGGSGSTGVVMPNEDGSISIKNTAYLQKGELANSPAIANNWVTLATDVRGFQRGDFETFRKNADINLDYVRQNRGVAKATETDEAIDKAPMAALASNLQKRINSVTNETLGTVSKETYAELVLLFDTIADLLERADGESNAHPETDDGETAQKPSLIAKQAKDRVAKAAAKHRKAS